jgi:hypothetical protein
MSGPQGTEWVDRIEELARVGAQAEAVLHEIRSELKEARRVIRQAHEVVGMEVDRVVKERIEQTVKAGLDDYADTVKTAMDSAVAHVEAEFDKLFTAYMKGSRTSQIDLRDLRPRQK